MTVSNREWAWRHARPLGPDSRTRHARSLAAASSATCCPSPSGTAWASSSGPELKAELLDYCRSRLATYKRRRTLDLPTHSPRAERQALQAPAARALLGRVQLAGDLARGVVSEEPADRFAGGGKMFGVLPRLEQLRGRRECGDLAAGLGRVVLINSREHEHRRAQGPHLVPGHADGEAGSPHRGGERLDLVAADIVALAHELLAPLLPEVVEEFPVALDDPARMLEDGRDDSFRREF